jgi:hypothetical protein
LGTHWKPFNKWGTSLKKTLKIGFGEKTHWEHITNHIQHIDIKDIHEKMPKGRIMHIKQNTCGSFLSFFQFCDVMEVTIIYKTI